jgi:hypothetical protein
MRDQEIVDLWEAYHSIYSNITESHFKVGDEVICKKSGMEGEIVKVDPEEKGKYYTVKREDGKMVKYAPDELKLEDEDEKEDNKEKDGGASKKSETKFHTKLDKLVHKTFGSSPEEKKMKEEVELDEDAPKRVDVRPASPRLMKNAGPARVHDPSKPSASKMVKRVDEETDLFDYILERLVAEGYADTNDAALAIMANMSGEWRQSIVESGYRGNSVGPEPLTVRSKPERDPNVKPGSRKGKTYGERKSDMTPGAQPA